MQVKKFEARTMKDALEMVKKQLGPDAIILSAKDNSKKYGLVGETSFEITAAVSEETLHKKKFAESRMADNDKQNFQNSSARMQKEIISKFVTKHTVQSAKPTTTQRYIDIADEKSVAEERIKNAAQRAFDAGANLATEVKLNQQRKPQGTRQKISESGDIQSLKSEIEALKQVISDFTKNRDGGSHYPGENLGIHYELSAHFQNLVREGIHEEMMAEMLVSLQGEVPLVKLKNKALVEGYLAKKILDTIIIGSENKNKFHFFIGPSGSGKTSSLIKMASQLIVKENKKVAVLTLDTNKVGAAEQLRIYSQILNVPFAILRDISDWREVLKFISSIDVVLVDTTGTSLKDQEEQQFLEKMMLKELNSKSVHLVLSARSKFEDSLESFNQFAVLGPTDVIFNHLDETTKSGNIYTFNQITKLPLFAFGIGQRIPEDFESATKERLVDLIFHITEKNIQKNEVSL